MAKKAMLVTVSITTRVIIESNKDEEKEISRAITAAIEKLNESPSEYIIGDNVGEVEEDTEIPYGELITDKN